MKPYRRLLVAGVVSGTLLILVPVIGILRGLSGALHTLLASGIGDPRSLAAGVAEILISMAVTLPFFAVGVVILIMSCVKLRQLRALEAPPLPPASA